MEGKKQGTEKSSFAMLLKLRQMWRSRRLRPILIRYIAPVLFALLLIVLAALPLISFRTVGGESEAKSLFYWHFANFFGADGARGAYELFTTVDSGNMYYGFYRAVVVVSIVDAIAAVLGFVLTVAFSASVLYLLLTEEETERSRFFGRIFRVAVGNRWTAVIPYVLSVLPFAFSKLFAYFWTVLRSYDTSAQFFVLDPLWIAAAFLAAEIGMILWARGKERGTKWDIFLAPDARVPASRVNEAETREWEEAVKADAEGDGFFVRGMGGADGTGAVSTEKDSDEPAKDEPTADEEVVFGSEIVIGTGNGTGTEKDPSEADGQSDAEMRRSLEMLFSDSDETDGEPRPKHGRK